MKKKKSLSETLKNYSLLTTALVGNVAAAQGQAIYTNVDPDLVMYPYGEYQLDLNNDGLFEYTLRAAGTDGTSYIRYSAWVLLEPGNSVASSLGRPLAGDYGININPDLAWNAGGFQLLAYSGDYPIWYKTGNFLGQTEKFLALRFNLNGEQHYGWARLSVHPYYPFSLTIHDYAYEATPGKAIVAGDTATLAACEIPTVLLSSKIKSTSVKLEWNAVSGADGYKVRYKVSGSNDWNYQFALGSSRVITGLSASTDYVWEIIAICTISPHLASDWSTGQSFTTLSARLTDESSQQISFQINPNPAEEHFTITFSTQANENATVIITITDVLGRQMLQQKSLITQGKLNEEILLNEKFTAGLYLVSIKVGDGFFTQPLIVQR